MKSFVRRFFQNFTEFKAQSVLTIGTLKVLKNHAWNEITIFREQKCRKQPKISEKMKKKTDEKNNMPIFFKFSQKSDINQTYGTLCVLV